MLNFTKNIKNINLHKAVFNIGNTYNFSFSGWQIHIESDIGKCITY